MELDITDFFLGCDDPMIYAASVAEYGVRAGPMTWENACRDASLYRIVQTEEEVAAAQKYFSSMGAWSEYEVDKWPVEDLNAMLIQDIAASMREGNLDSDATQDDWEYYEALIQTGQVSGNLFKSDDGRIYYTIGG